MLIEAFRCAFKLNIKPKFPFRGTSGKSGKPLYLGPSSGNCNNPGAPTIYDSRKYGHKLPTNEVTPCFKVPKCFPTGVFRNTAGETLGVCGAAKCGCYQNPEYFSHHHMSFYDMNLYMNNVHQRTVPVTGRKPDII